MAASRDGGYRRGLVVLATGLGKTWLAAFDAVRMGARRILFVAHREEILGQAAVTFVRILPKKRVGYYTGRSRDADVDVLCASVQTLAKAEHLERFAPQHFDYVVIDEFHHAAAGTYRRLLTHFAPSFLLGLTATPDRTDQSDILSLCDDNLHLRGPGELLGIRQSGIPMLKIADLERDVELLEAARAVADRLLGEQPQAVERHLQRWMGRAQEYVKV